MFYHLLQINFFPVILCLLFAGYILIDKCFENKIKRYFFFTVVAILILIVIDDIEYIELQRPQPSTLRYIGISLGYIVRPFIPIMVAGIFAESNHKEYSFKKHLLFFLPFILNALIVLGSPWNHLVYSFSPDNHFIRGPLGYITFAIGFFYMGVMVAFSLKSVKIRKPGEAAVIIMLAVLCVISTMMESLFLFVGFLSGACIIGTVLYYLYLHVTIYSMDSLTGAYNRRIFYLDVSKIKYPVVLVSMDLNNLKTINDSEGHHKGDEFIIEFSNQVLRTKSKGSHFYRLGGDEFSLICKHVNADTVKQKIESIQHNMNCKGYSFAYGMNILHPDDNIQSIMDITDQMMYQKKMSMKHQNL